MLLRVKIGQRSTLVYFCCCGDILVGQIVGSQQQNVGGNVIDDGLRHSGGVGIRWRGYNGFGLLLV